LPCLLLFAVRGIAERGRVAANAVLALLGRLLTGADLPLAGKACAVLYITGWVGRVITPVGLLYLGACALTVAKPPCWLV
jgi:hypothetical protein